MMKNIRNIGLFFLGSALCSTTVMQTLAALDIGNQITNSIGPNIHGYDPIGNNTDPIFILIDYSRRFKVLISILAVLFIVIAGIRMITASGNEEITKKNRTSIIWLCVGLIIMNVAETFVFTIYYPAILGGFESYGVAIPSGIQNQLVNPLLNFIITFLVIIAVLMVIMAAMKIMTAQGDDGKIKKQTQTLIGALLGLGLILIAKPVVEGIYGYGSAPNPQVGDTVKIITMIANYIMGFTALAAIVVIIIAGIMMVVNFGNDQRVQKAKKIIMWVLIGLAVILSSYAIVVTLIAPQL